MMKNKSDYATAVRKPDGEIEIQKEQYVSMTEKVKFCSLPFVRGVFNFVDSMILGMRTLSFSAGFYEDDEDSEPGPFEMWLDKVFGEKVEKALMAVVMVFSVVMAIGIFMVLPLLIAGGFRRFVSSPTVMAILEGCIRIGIFVTYILLISRMEDIRRTFMYHGAEHKCINCIEHGMTLTVDHVRQSSKQHKRCGTSFLIIVMVISILFFMVIRVETVWLRIVSRILLIPVIAGVSYEFLRIAGRSDSALVNLLSKPGMWMQNLTTKEPDDSMIEVAIAAVNAVFDWKAYLRENFPETKIREDQDL
jgi:Predicted metal-dependent enzyme